MDLLCARLRATGAIFFCCTGWLVFHTGGEVCAWGRVMAPKYADISCLRAAFEADYGWLYCVGHRARGFTTAVSHREHGLINPPSAHCQILTKNRD